MTPASGYRYLVYLRVRETTRNYPAMAESLTRLYRHYLRQINRLPVLYLRSVSVSTTLTDESVNLDSRPFFRLKAADDTRAVARTKDTYLCNRKCKRVRKVWSVFLIAWCTIDDIHPGCAKTRSCQ